MRKKSYTLLHYSHPFLQGWTYRHRDIRTKVGTEKKAEMGKLMNAEKEGWRVRWTNKQNKHMQLPPHTSHPQEKEKISLYSLYVP